MFPAEGISPMPRFPIPATIDEAPAASRALLRTAEARFGRVPNMALLLSVSPAALQGYLALLTALDGGTLGAQTAERIALAVAEANGCQYGLSLHTFRARNGIGLDDAEITANRSGASNDPQADAAVCFAAKLVRSAGRDRRRRSPRAESRRLRRRADHRDRSARRPQHARRHHQQGLRTRHRLPPHQNTKG